MNIAVIPARGGSQRIPRKNLRPFCGKPMLQWSIEAAVASACFDRILVSTDDPEISGLAIASGAEVPFLRPAELSDAFTDTSAVVRHAVDWLATAGVIDRADCLVCCLYATAPFVAADDIRRGRDLLIASGHDYALAVTRFPAPVQRALVDDGAGRLRPLYPEFAATRSQDLAPAFHDAGQFCWGRAAAWLSGQNVLEAGCVPVMIAAERVRDIDTEEDWRLAERMFAALPGAGGRSE